MSDLRGEERLVTVVFSDMTESVRRTSGLTAEEATVLVNPLLETMVELMVRFGGRIDRFLGDGVLAVFGVPASHEDDPFRAVRAALELRERAADLGLAVTSGVNTGRVYFGPVGSELHEELTVMGPTVNLAARFQSSASAGEIVVGQSTAAHLRAAFELTPVTLTIKGIGEPVGAFKAERLLDHPDKVRGVEGLRAEMIGRDDELEDLVSVLGAGAAAAVIGPAGVGKSRLASEFRTQVVAAGGRWLEGRCLELTQTTSYAPFVDLFARHLPQGDRRTGLVAVLESMTADGVLSPERVDAIAPFLAHLLGTSLGDDRDLRVRESSAELRRTLAIGAVVEYLTAWSRSGPAVVFLDDVHWADSLSRDVIRALARSESDLLLLLAYRPDDAAPGYFDDDVPLLELRLEALSRGECQRLISRLLTTSGLPGWLETQILEHAQGNPFYVEELIRSLIQKGAIARTGTGWTTAGDGIELELPESVEGVLMSRFDRLASSTRRAAKAASVLDRSFDEATLAAIAGHGLVGELETLTGAGILVAEPFPPTRYSFVHALTRQAIYLNLLPSQRAELHEQAARALENAPDQDVEQIATHYAASRNHSKAVEYQLRAGERSLAAFTNDTARAFLESGMRRIEELEEDMRAPWRGRYLARLGELFERMALHTEARAALTSALSEGGHDPISAAGIARLIGQTHRLEGDFDAAHEAYDQAERLLGDADDEQSAAREWIRVQKERGMALYFGGRGRELPDHNARVEPVVALHGTAAQQADHLYGQVLSSFVDDRFVVPAATVMKARQALDLAERGADPGRVAEGRFGLGFALLWADQVPEAAETLTRTVEETIRLGAVTEGCRARAYLAVALRRLGDVEAAAGAAADALVAARGIGSSYYEGHALAVACWVAWKRGEECDELGAEAFAAWGPLERDGVSGLDTEFAWLAVWPRVAAAIQRHDFDAAVDHLRAILTPWERPMPDEVRDVVVASVSDRSRRAIETAIGVARSHGYL
jgi:class 3 adenylate cyclase/tetratricopeptide (TPR) repeat protein